MKTLKLLTAMMLMLVAMAAGAETISDVTIGNLVYSLDTDTKVATVTGYDSSNKPTDVVIPNTIEYGGNYSVTTIGEWAFSDCYSLASIDIPNSVTTIGRRAFCYCASLTSVNIGESVTTIGVGAFIYCYYITSVTCLAKECPVCDKGLWNNIFSVFIGATSSSSFVSLPRIFRNASSASRITSGCTLFVQESLRLLACNALLGTLLFADFFAFISPTKVQKKSQICK